MPYTMPRSGLHPRTKSSEPSACMSVVGAETATRGRRRPEPDPPPTSLWRQGARLGDAQHGVSGPPGHPGRAPHGPVGDVMHVARLSQALRPHVHPLPECLARPPLVQDSDHFRPGDVSTDPIGQVEHGDRINRTEDNDAQCRLAISPRYHLNDPLEEGRADASGPARVTRTDVTVSVSPAQRRVRILQPRRGRVNGGTALYPSKLYVILRAQAGGWIGGTSSRRRGPGGAPRGGTR